MADNKPTSNYYRNLGGINQKASEYSLTKAQFLNLRNVDFDVPNSLQKRPGSTQAIFANTSGPINSVFEFIKLDGSSYIIAGSDTAMFYYNSMGSTLQVLSTGWTNGQPADMLTFVNKLWIANGQNFIFWGGGGATPLPAGEPGRLTPADTSVNWGVVGNTNAFDYISVGGSIWTVGGETMVTMGTSFIAVGVYVGYSYLRDDGYVGPFDPFSSRNTIRRTITSGEEWFSYSLGTASFPAFNILGGITIPSGHGITAIQVWLGLDKVTAGSSQQLIVTNSAFTTQNRYVGALGWMIPQGGANKAFMSVTLRPGADTSKFRLFTTIPASNLFFIGASIAQYGATYNLSTPNDGGGSFGYWASLMPNIGPSGMPFWWFNSNTPKYLDINQNSMFMAGFSQSPSTIWFSDVGEPEVIDVDSSIEVRTNDGDRIYGIKAYNNILMVMKEGSFHKVIGDNADNYQLVDLSNEYGCLSDKTIVEYKEKLLWLDRKGIIEFNGASWSIISDAVEDIFRRMNLSAAKENACAVHFIYRNQVWFGIPIDGATKNNITIVYDYLVDAWTFFDGFNPASFGFIKSSLTKPTVFTGNYSGIISYFGESFMGDNGAGFTCYGFSRYEQYVGENETSIWRRFFLDVAPATNGVTAGLINVNVYSDYNGSTIKATFPIYQNIFQTRAEIGVVAKACAFEFSHNSATLPLLINGYSWAKRPIRNV